ncbi:MAG: VanZ family protein [Saprospiraceae bacterium]|nr:VanZ family protein [Saprospiraceae bacterium]
MFLKFNLLGIIWGFIILVLSILPGNYFPKVPTYLELFSPDKLIHLFIFGVLAIFLLHGFQKQYSFIRLRSHNIIYATTIGIIYGCFTELLQLIINNGRHASIYDFVADLIGCLIGLIIYRLFIIKKQKI